MKFVSEYREEALVAKLLHDLEKKVTQEWVIMEICGGQTHAIVRYGLDELLPDRIELVHGPGCPVCVTPLELIDKAISIAAREEVIFTSYGDMLRVPGSERDLFKVRAEGGDVRVVYSPLDALRIAEDHPDHQVVFFAIGFETTAPANAMSVVQAKRKGIGNFSLLVSHVRVPPAIEAILSSPRNRVQAFLAAGHVCTVMGYGEYPPLAEKFSVPITVTGFEPLDILQGLHQTVSMLEEGRVAVENAYARVVSFEGNKPGQAVIKQAFEECDRSWRGVGMIPASGWRLREEYRAYDAEFRFDVASIRAAESPLCIAGEILQGRKKPLDCPAFGLECTPQTPLGATMVSSEGACAAYYQYGRQPVHE